jgi:hypothetical protein
MSASSLNFGGALGAAVNVAATGAGPAGHGSAPGQNIGATVNLAAAPDLERLPWAGPITESEQAGMPWFAGTEHPRHSATSAAAGARASQVGSSQAADWTGAGRLSAQWTGFVAPRANADVARGRPSAETAQSHAQEVNEGEADADAEFLDDSVTAVSRKPTRAERAAEGERGGAATSTAPLGDFWARVVDAQHVLTDNPNCPPHEALGLAIAWAIAAAGLEAPLPQAQTPTAAGRAPLGPSAQSASSSARDSTTLGLELSAWVGNLHSELAHKASRALVVAWEQRGSALRAATLGKG